MGASKKTGTDLTDDSNDRLGNTRNWPGNDLVIASNRGPISFQIDNSGNLIGRRGGGGLVSGLGPLVTGTGATWIAAAMTEGDRQAARQGIINAEGFQTRLISFDEATYQMAYDVICNSTLWFAHHALWDLSQRPRFDLRWREAWDAYRRFNHHFAQAIADEAPEGAAVLIQDYHLSLVAAEVRPMRPDLRLAHFSHTPFAGPDQIRVLPDQIAVELLEGLAANHVCGFHAKRWADAFSLSCEQVIGRVPTTIVAPLAPDREDIVAAARTDQCNDALRELIAEVSDRQLIVRVDRIELSKNILRGFHAFDDMLERHPKWREHVVFAAFCYPSREGLPEYLAYRQQIETLVNQLNSKWSTPTWRPIIFDASDDFPKSVAALRLYDLLLVNPISDGLNLVAMEGPLVNEREGLVALSTEAGAFAILKDAVRRLNPFDTYETAEVLAEVLDCSQDERSAEAQLLVERVRARTPANWLADQLTALSKLSEPNTGSNPTGNGDTGFRDIGFRDISNA